MSPREESPASRVAAQADRGEAGFRRDQAKRGRTVRGDRRQQLEEKRGEFSAFKREGRRFRWSDICSGLERIAQALLRRAASPLLCPRAYVSSNGKRAEHRRGRSERDQNPTCQLGNDPWYKARERACFEWKRHLRCSGLAADVGSASSSDIDAKTPSTAVWSVIGLGEFNR